MADDNHSNWRSLVASDLPSRSASNIDREIGVFWDYENLPLPSGTNVLEACQVINQTISHFGQIRDQRLYYDFGGSTAHNSSSWTAFDSQLDLVNTPRRNGSKETLDKKLISDIWAFAWDRRGSASCSVVLMSSDGDYAHTLNKLRHRGIQCIVIHGATESLSKMLTSSADVSLSLKDDILGPAPSMMMQRIATMETSSTVSHTSISENPVLVEPTVKATETRESQSLTSMMDQNEIQGKQRVSRAIALCKALGHLNADDSDNCSWIKGPSASAKFASMAGLVDANDRLQILRDTRSVCEQLHWVEHGYRVLLPDKKIIATESVIASDPKLKAANRGEDYLRLTKRGVMVSKSLFSTSQLKRSCLFIKNIASKSSITELVRHLESNYGVHVVLAQRKAAASPYFWFARIKVLDENEADLLVQASVTLHGRWLEISEEEWAFALLDSQCVIDPFGDAAAPSAMLKTERTLSTAAVSNVEDSLNRDAMLLVETCKDQGAGWIDGVKLGMLFKTALCVSGSTKQRFRKAYREAWAQGIIEMGRQREEPHSVIETVGPDEPSAGYRLGLYFKLAPVVAEETARTADNKSGSAIDYSGRSHERDETETVIAILENGCANQKSQREERSQEKRNPPKQTASEEPVEAIGIDGCAKPNLASESRPTAVTPKMKENTNIGNADSRNTQTRSTGLTGLIQSLWKR